VRWLVERTRDQFEDVGAESLEIADGCLVFRAGDDPLERPNYIVAAGHWISVCEAAE
jgi:hypothetical protein